MSKKFLKILGICLLIIILPVLITVSAVCLTEDGKGGVNDGSYTVHSVYADDVKVSMKDEKWTLEKVPTRKYYTFAGISVNGKTYKVTNGVVELTKEEKTTFEKDVKAGKPITSEWDCVYSCLNIAAFGGKLENSLNAINIANYNTTEEALGEGHDFLFESKDLEVFGFLTEIEYQNIQTQPVSEFEVYVDVDGDGTIEQTEIYNLTFGNKDKTKAGDITIRTILDKLDEKGVTVPKTTNGYAEIIING